MQDSQIHPEYLFICCIRFKAIYYLQECFQNLQNSIFPVRRAGIFGSGLYFRAGVGDCVAESCVLEHFYIVEIVSEGTGFFRGDSEIFLQKGKRRSFS